jgi:putative transcriptional regulator
MITPSKILSSRQAAGLSQAKAAALIGYTLAAWQQWEHGRRAIHPSIFELFLLKSGQHPLLELTRKVTIVND